LCAGHVLNQGLQSASRVTVIQRKDIDNYYGYSVEPDFVRMLNLGVASQEELIAAPVTSRSSPPGARG
jgi:hypothetical protein